MTVLYTNPPKNEPVAVRIGDKLACTERCYVSGPWDKPTEVILPGEVHTHELGNACSYCGKTIV